ncbi:MAG TPA: DUF3379 domain-containing protein [Vibrio sp.]|uniref:DUF3379 family protein n=1 Tax=Vibrio TaxID=662 RepID=UPI000488B34A|nr:MULTISPECIES: DUF3379 family protein [Vibrio]HCH02822.1 DUF3379 domain-containing protein [Vibrio sp.]
MDDLELRRRLLSDPNDKSDDILVELRTNPKNKNYAESLQQLDKKIEQALTVDVPDDLADKILFQHNASDQPHISFSRKAFALAASIIFTFGLLVGQINWGNFLVEPAHASLDSMAIHHIKEEEPFIVGVNEGNGAQEINAKLSAYSYKLNGDFPYHIYYLNHCGFSHDHHALHMVFQGKQGRVTAFISNIEAKQTSQFTQGNMQGEIIPLTQGSLVLVGEKGENIAALSQKITPMLNFDQ